MTPVPNTSDTTGAPGGFDLRGFLANLARRAAAATAARRAKARDRQDYARLRRLHDALLRDMGITRAGIDEAERGL